MRLSIRSAASGGSSPASYPAVQEPERQCVSLLVSGSEEVEVAALVCLKDMVEVEGSVAPAVVAGSGSQAFEAAFDLFWGNLEIESAVRDVEDDWVAIFDDREWTPGG